MKRTLFRITMLILLGLTFVSIFNFSNQDGQASSGLSRKVARTIIDILPQTKKLNEQAKNEAVEKSQTIIRKGAHLSIYALVGLLMMNLMCTYKISNKNKFLITILVGIIYASSDEIHQSFIPGRTAAFTDICIDTSGAILGSLIAFGCINSYIKLKKKI